MLRCWDLNRLMDSLLRFTRIGSAALFNPPIRFVRHSLVPPEGGVRCTAQATSQEWCRAFRPLEPPGATKRNVPGTIPGTLVPREVSMRDPSGSGWFRYRSVPLVDRRASSSEVIVVGIAAQSG